METSVSRNSTQDVFDFYPRLMDVQNYVNQNYADNISLRDAANIACLEEKYFSSFFREKTGICFSHWLAQLRVNKAKEIMLTNNISITETAFFAGFRDLRTFQRAFKKYAGITPQNFKYTTQLSMDNTLNLFSENHET